MYNKDHETMAKSWYKRVVFNTEQIKASNPVPGLLATLFNMLPKGINKAEINTIVTELYNNAVDHGLLSLNSDIKQQSEGLEKFYQLRKILLSNLDYGRVEFNFYFNNKNNLFTIEVSDCGNGFDFDAYTKEPLMLHKLSGKGLYLINQLANNIKYLGDLNTLVVQYRLKQQEEISLLEQQAKGSGVNQDINSSSSANDSIK